MVSDVGDKIAVICVLWYGLVLPSARDDLAASRSSILGGAGVPEGDGLAVHARVLSTFTIHARVRTHEPLYERELPGATAEDA